jgi:hypothetical protein
LKCAQQAVQEEEKISARQLARHLVAAAEEIDGAHAKDDITCGVIYFRCPRKLMVATGPPFVRHRDGELARLLADFRGRKVISGGTTANIISRELGRNVTMNIIQGSPGVPPTAAMEGIDLITEGTLTLGRVAALLEEETAPALESDDAATRLASLMLDSDIVHFVVGTRINEAHQDPNIPVELDLRRNIIRRIIHQLEQRYCKATHLRFL